MFALRNTKQRQVIMDILSTLKGHPTAEELFVAVRQDLPRISLGTIYRNLDVLAREGMVSKIESSGKQRKFDPIVNQHYHIKCLECGRLDDVILELQSDLICKVSKMTRYHVTGQKIEFIGFCPDCCSKKELMRKKYN